MLRRREQIVDDVGKRRKIKRDRREQSLRFAEIGDTLVKGIDIPFAHHDPTARIAL